MWREVELLLEDSSPERRQDGWARLQRLCLREDFLPTAEQLLALERRLREEREQAVWRAGVTALAFVAAWANRRDSEADNRPRPRALADWLWDAFHETSAAFGLLDPKHRQRDELAKILLGRHLSNQAFPRSVFHLVYLGDPALDELVCNHHYGALAIIGRLNLYGREALQHWSDCEARFAFPSTPRPDGLKPGDLDRDYHQIVDRTNGRRGQHVTLEKDGKRTDYGLVQRYSINAGLRDVTVVTIAGASSLGTLAAMQWATVELMQPISRGGDVIPVSGGIEADSRMEALLEVTAQSTDFNWQWKPSQLRLVRLSVDRAVWSQERRGWYVEPPERITVVLDRADASRVTDVLFDGKPSPLRKNSRSFRLLACMCTRAYNPERRTIDPVRLGEDAAVWGETETQSERQVRRHLTQLKFRYLGKALEIDRDIRLDAQVAVQRGAAGS